MGWVAERVGVRWTVVGGASMVLLGLILSVGGSSWELYVGHGLLIGLVGNAALNAPIYVYVSRWFQRRRGTALSLISSGQYIAGALWPPVFERTIALFGWRSTMVGFGVAAAGTIIPLALVYLKASPPSHQPASLPGRNQSNARPALSPNVFFLSLLIASFLCCIPMAMPSAHLIAFCGDLGMLPVRGALALSMLLVCAFISRQFWGWVSDRYGGLPTLVVCSAVQAAATAGFRLHAIGGRTICGCGRVWPWIQRTYPCLHPYRARIVPSRTGLLARPNGVLLRHVGHGDGKLGGGAHLRLHGLLCSCFRDRPHRQSGEFGDTATPIYTASTNACGAGLGLAFSHTPERALPRL